MILCTSADCSTALPGQGAFASIIQVIFYSVHVAAEERFRHVQAFQTNTKVI